MLSLFKRYRQPLLVAVLLLYPLFAFLSSSGRKVREPNFLDRAVLALVSPVQRGLVGVLDGGTSLARSYVALKGVQADNDALRLENLELRAQVQALGEARLENDRLKKLLGYADALPSGGTKVAARVVGINPVAKLLSVRINRGTADGVQHGMSVVTPDGIVGKVMRATGGWADVALITDPQSRVGVRVQRSRARATATGAGAAPLKLENLLRTEDVQDGDLVITSGTDGVFPPGLVVGRVTALERKDFGMFQGAQIVPAVDTTKLEEVLVVPASSLALAEPPTQTALAPEGSR